MEEKRSHCKTSSFHWVLSSGRGDVDHGVQAGHASGPYSK